MATYIATQTLFVGMAATHQPGDVVPEENIKPNGWEDSVVKAGTKAAEKAQEAPAPDGSVASQSPPLK